MTDRETCSVTLTPSGKGEAGGVLIGYPANPPYAVKTAREVGRLHVTVHNGWRAVGSGTLTIDMGDLLDEAARPHWHGEVQIDTASWLCRGVVGSGVLEFRSPSVP